MSEFNATKLNSDNINEGKKFNDRDGFSASDLNQIVEGVVYASENGGNGLTAEEKEKVDKLVIDGTGDKFLADDGEYKEVGGSNTVDLSEYQKKTDNSLETESKDIVGAINEVNGKAGQGGSSIDVQIDGDSIVENGVANIPKATNNSIGLGKGSPERGTGVETDGTFIIYQASNQDIRNKTDLYKPITPYRLDYAVKMALSDCKLSGSGVWTDEEKENARELLGTKKLYMHNIIILQGDVTNPPDLYTIKLQIINAKADAYTSYANLREIEGASTDGVCTQNYHGVTSAYGYSLAEATRITLDGNQYVVDLFQDTVTEL